MLFSFVILFVISLSLEYKILNIDWQYSNVIHTTGQSPKHLLDVELIYIILNNVVYGMEDN